MPLPRHHGGSGRLPVIPTDWTDSPASVVSGSLATSGCTVAIGEPGGEPVWNPVTEQTETPNVPPVYVGRAEIKLVTDTDTIRFVVGEEVSVRVYAITIPADAALVEVGQVVRVTADPDPDLQGKTLTLRAIERGTRRFSRRLLATLTD